MVQGAKLKFNRLLLATKQLYDVAKRDWARMHGTSDQQD